MNKRQKEVLINFVVVRTVTAIVIIAMINFRDWINRSEATRAMEHLSKIVLAYRAEKGTVPPEFEIERIKKTLEGHARLGELKYRARWIDFESTSDEILAYIRKEYSSLLLSDGYIVLRLDGRVEWMGVEEFEKLLAQQQSTMEIQMQQH